MAGRTTRSSPPWVRPQCRFPSSGLSSICDLCNFQRPLNFCSEVTMNFIGQTLALDSSRMDNVAAALNMQPQSIWAVLQVEAAQCGFLPDRRPTLLFERHIFY